MFFMFTLGSFVIIITGFGITFPGLPFAGTMVILGCNDKEEILSLTDEQVVSLLDEFGEPETPDDWVDDDVNFTREDIHALLDVMINKLFS